MEELGIVDDFMKIPHVKAPKITMETAIGPAVFADFTALPAPYSYMAFMPQWDVLNFLAETGRSYPNFRLEQETKVTELVTADGRIAGVRAHGPSGSFEVRANLVIGADGRNSVTRSAGGFEVAGSVAPMDTLWFRLSRLEGEKLPTVRAGKGYFIGCLNREQYWQIFFMIPKGGYGTIQAGGIERFRATVRDIYDTFEQRLSTEIRSWDDVKHLDVRVDRLRRWHRRGLLCIGDAAHAMSPAGGVGINLAVQDAVAAARILGPTLAAGYTPSPAELHRVQRRRQLPMRVVQLVQLYFLSDLYPSAARKGTERPMVVRLSRRFPRLPRLIARLIGLGVRPERIPEPISGSSSRRHDEMMEN
jgi:2-polyprenyl-6-methoxyphenol hydroxylase-like FAD-dependent oxidoreductase